ncbi:MAG: hypothetical protein ACYCOU_12735 [Sulfobacillus sp.]
MTTYPYLLFPSLPDHGDTASVDVPAILSGNLPPGVNLDLVDKVHARRFFDRVCYLIRMSVSPRYSYAAFNATISYVNEHGKEKSETTQFRLAAVGPIYTLIFANPRDILEPNGTIRVTIETVV